MVNIENACALLNLLKSRMTFVKANLKKGHETRRGRPNLTQTYLDITQVNSDIKVKLDDLWMMTNKLHMMRMGLTVIVFDSLALDLLNRYENGSHKHSLSHIEDLPQNIIGNAVSFVDLSEKQGQLTEEQVSEVERYIVKQNAIVHLSANIGVRINHNEVSEAQEAQLHRIKQRVAKTKCARAIINCFLSFNDISYEHQDDFLELKLKYRCPPDINEPA